MNSVRDARAAPRDDGLAEAGSRRRVHAALISLLVAAVMAGVVSVAGAQTPPDSSEEGAPMWSDLADAGVRESAARTLADAGVFDGTGCDTGRLCPQGTIARWELAVWLVRVLDGQDPDPVPSRFDDVDDTLWWAPHTERLAQLEVTVGCSVEPLNYCPDRPTTRAETASFLVRAFQLPAAESAGFADTVGNSHEANIDALFAAGVTVGCVRDPLQFCTDRPTTRAEMASFLHGAQQHADSQSDNAQSDGTQDAGSGTQSSGATPDDDNDDGATPGRRRNTRRRQRRRRNTRRRQRRRRNTRAAAQHPAAARSTVAAIPMWLGPCTLRSNTCRECRGT